MSNNKYKILLIEDEGNIRRFLKTMLTTNQYQVFDAVNAREGMMMVRNHYPMQRLYREYGVQMMWEVPKNSK